MALVFFDLDGTVLDRGQPAKGVIEAIEELKKNNHTVAIATGRSPIVLYDADKLLGIDYLVLANGSYVSYKGEEIYANYIPNEVVKRLMDYCDEIEVDLAVVYLDRYVAYRKDTNIADEYSKIFKIDLPKLDHKFHPEENVFAFTAFGDETVEKMRKAFPELLFSKSNDMGYDVNNVGGLKADGVKALIKILNYPEDDVYVFGDGHNDLTMLKAVKHGVAMGNASDELKAVAEYVTTDVNDYGVYNALKHYKLI